MENYTRSYYVKIIENEGDEFHIGLKLLESSSTGKLVEDNIKKTLVRESLEAGRKAAKRIRNEHPSTPIEKIAESLGASISYKRNSDNGSAYGSKKFRCIYIPQKKVIEIYLDSAERLESLISEKDLSEYIDPKLIVDLFIAHELYHHIENINKEFMRDRHTVTTMKMGPIKFRSKVNALGEIAAHTFAKELTGIKIFPTILDKWDLLTMEPAVPITSDDLMKKVKQMNRRFFLGPRADLKK